LADASIAGTVDKAMTALPRTQLTLLRSLAAYVIRIRPDAIATTLLGVLSSALELAALTSLIPLSQLAGHQAIREGSLWERIPALLGQSPGVKFYALMFLVLLLLRTISQTLSAVLTQHLNRKLIAHFSARTLEALVHHLTFEQVQKESVGHFVTLAGDEANRAAQIIAALMRLVPLATLFLLYIATIVYQSWKFGAGLFAFILVTVACLWGAFRKSHALGGRQQRESRALNTHFIESLGGLRTVRSLTGEQFVSNRYDLMIRAYARTCFSIDAINQVSSAMPTALLVTGLGIAVWQFATPTWLTASLPAIMVGAMMVLRLLPLAGQTLDIAMRLTADLKAAENITEMLDVVKSAAARNASPLPDLHETITNIKFENVSFRYSPDTPQVLENFSMTFEAGKSYAITGPSGSGKSSLVDLLLKFFQPQSGAISINGRNIASISDLSLRRRILLSEQATRIFYDTVQHNVLFGRDAPPESASSALDMVGLREFIASLPEGELTLLNYQGSNFSGGQRQRVGLARALLLPSDVLILDESTSALDHATREKILATILPRYREKILIFVAHDPAILAHVDEVILLQPGGTVEVRKQEPALAS
jgi:ABC-type bacteriocin/lantibiotic exporter with double-glycine peptidase domain